MKRKEFTLKDKDVVDDPDEDYEIEKDEELFD
jgi:hypothetical protein